MEKVTGTCKVIVNNQSLRSKEKATLEMGGIERTPIMIDGESIAYSEKIVPSKITATLAHVASNNLLDLNGVNLTIQFVTDTGAVYVINGAVSAKPAKLTGGEGDCEVEYFGPPAEPST